MGFTFWITPENYSTAEQNGISAKLLTDRVRSFGWDLKRATTNPPRELLHRKEWVAIAKANNILPRVFYHRVNKGMSQEQASTIPVMDKQTAINNLAIKKRKYPKEYEEMAVANGINKKTFISRMHRKWKPLEAATVPVKHFKEATK